MNHHEIAALQAAHRNALALTEHPHATAHQVAEAHRLVDETAAELDRIGAPA